MTATELIDALLDLRRHQVIDDTSVTIMLVLHRWAQTHDTNDVAIISLTIICDRTGQPKATVCRRLAKLEAAGIISRTASTLRPDPLASPVTQYQIQYSRFGLLAAGKPPKELEVIQAVLDMNVRFPRQFVRRSEFTSSTTAKLTMMQYSPDGESPAWQGELALRFPAQKREIITALVEAHSRRRLKDAEADTIFRQVTDITLPELAWLMAKVAGRKPKDPRPGYYIQVFRLLMAMPPAKRVLPPRRTRMRRDSVTAGEKKYQYRTTEPIQYADHLARKMAKSPTLEGCQEFVAEVGRLVELDQKLKRIRKSA